MLDFNKLKFIFINNRSFILTTHVNPDADAIGSEVALFMVLKELNKEVHIINYSSTPYNLKFLDAANKIEKYEEPKHAKLLDDADVLVAIDFNRSDRIIKMKNGFIKSKKIKICIDHHQDPENFVNYMFCDTSYSATGHIIYDLIKKTGIVKLKYETAYPIYAAIMTDTGSFRFERTTPEIHDIAAELLKLNVDPGEVYDKIYDESKYSKIKLMGRALNSMQLYGKKKQISYMFLNRNSFNDIGALESDTDGFVNYALSVEGVKVGILFIELKDGFKVSFRSKGKIPVNKLAAEFGGGGHINASGVRFFNSSLNDYLEIILKKAEKYLESNKG